MKRLVVLVALVACGDRRAPTTIDAGPPPVTAPAAPDLLDLVPADAAYVLAIRTPLGASARARLAWDVGPFVARLAVVAAGRLDDHTIEDPIDRVLAALLAQLPGPVDSDTRLVLHELHGVPVLRVEVADAVALEAAVARAWVRAQVAPAPLLDDRDETLAVARRGRVLTLAFGPTADVHAIAPMLAGTTRLDAPRLDPAALAGKIGFVDLGALFARLVATPALEAWLHSNDAPAGCRAALDEVVGLARDHLPRVVLRAAAGDATEVSLEGELELDPALARALTPPAAIVPGISMTFPGRPIVGVTLAAPPGVPDTMVASAGALARLADACGTGVRAAKLPGDGRVRGVSAAFYGVTMSGWLPTDVQGYLAVSARDPDGLLDDVATTLPSLRGKQPKDGAPPIKLAIKDLAPFVAAANLTRRGESLVFGLGTQGIGHAEAALAATDAAPILHVFVDVTRLATPPDADDLMNAGAGMLDEAGLRDLWFRLVSTLDVTVRSAPTPTFRLAATLTPPTIPPASSTPDPAQVAASTCRRLLARAWTSSSRSLTRMGITDLDPYEDRLLGGFGTGGFVQACVALPDAARACLRAAPDVLAALATCGAPDLEPPELFDHFAIALDDAPHPMDVALGVHAPKLAQLAGTWISTTDPHDRWVIAASGKATHDGDRYTLAIVSDGKINFHSRGGYSPGGFVLDGADDLYLAIGDAAFPLADEDHVVVEDDRWPDHGWVVMDPQGCFAIDVRGRTSTETCGFADRDGARWFDASGLMISYRILAGHIASQNVATAHFHRAP